MSAGLPTILRQFAAFSGVSVLVFVVHYAVLIGLEELFRVAAVPAALTGYTVGGLVSYVLNRRLAFASERPHAEAGWRFAVVMGVGFLLTLALMTLFVNRLALPYLPAQIVTTGMVFLWNFAAHKWWTFGR